MEKKFRRPDQILGRLSIALLKPTIKVKIREV